ncbi:D-glycero-beta-D-manno-heptose 1-phosphate adenylyltransferase [Silvanigrella paludirubra]|uniref:Bifunctional protein HldE n=1 Tax=Silvanigrella paludirubra TaxID=2499159 RepID=A0A6N6VYG3_9BACT|nr:D-glycero-beta-D-manno-heptose 1-phosphate adenylyltransferase [Silvanigrella paludirubra]KAB8039896.1 D-glycero-beta-D-manno-heptose 1-phosphate adenylyltransferase [Silvanigrella paludirubra]
MIKMERHSTPEDVLSLKNTRIFIAGDIILDTYIEGKVSRISPEAPVPVVLETHRKAVPGGAGNVAANVASMGGAAFLCGRVGNDSEANVLKGILEDFGIDIHSLIISKEIPTTTKMRIVSGNMLTSGAQQIVRVDKEKNEQISQEEENRVLDLYENFLKFGGNRCLIISDYGKGFLTKTLIRSLIKLSKQYHIPVVTDPKSEDVFRYAGSTVIKPNLNEGRSVLKVIKPGSLFTNFDEEINTIADCYLETSGSENLVMSLSEHGVMCKGKNIDGTLKINTHALQVSDVSGAGDTLISFLAMSLAAGLSIERATELGNIAAGIACGKAGTATISLSEFLEALKMRNEAIHPEKLMSLDSLTQISQDLKIQNKRSVFTNGCFDILHAGHVDYLQKARSRGDLLIVGLNSDSSVSKLKGPSRPVQTSSDRAAILASLACVDYIVIFEEDTPIELIKALKPNILVKGADYTIENTIGAKEVLSWGGSVELISLLPGRSTTSIIQKAQIGG